MKTQLLAIAIAGCAILSACNEKTNSGEVLTATQPISQPAASIQDSTSQKGKITDYIIVTAGRDAIASEVKAKIAEGWQPSGGIMKEDAGFFQAMVR